MLGVRESRVKENEKDLRNVLQKLHRHPVRNKANLKKAHAWIQNASQEKSKMLRHFWRTSWEISPHIFLLLASSYGADTIRRKDPEEIGYILTAGGRLNGEPEVIALLSPLLQEYGLPDIPRTRKLEELLHSANDIDPERLSHLSDINEQTRSIWAEVTTGIPLVASSASCWRSRCPSYEEIWLEAIALSPKSSMPPKLISTRN
jgi:hypothetical protein